MSKDTKNEKKEFINPIDKDKIAENPGLLPYAHTVGGSVIKPLDEGRVKGNALAAMEQQTDMQMAQLYKQMELLAEQAKAIQKRKEVSEMVYELLAWITQFLNIWLKYDIYARRWSIGIC